MTVTIPAGGSGNVLVIATAQLFGVGGNATANMSVSLDGGVAVEANALKVTSNNDPFRASATSLFSGVAPGQRTFTAVYRLDGSGSATFELRSLIVIPL